MENKIGIEVSIKHQDDKDWIYLRLPERNHYMVSRATRNINTTGFRSGYIFIKDPKVSRDHCIIYLDAKENKWFILDNSSKNHTYVDHVRIAQKTPYPVTEDSIITVGQTTIKIGLPSRKGDERDTMTESMI